MEIVDKYDNKKIPLNKKSERHAKVPNEYRLSAHVWIVNSQGEFLIQKRNPQKRKYPNMWSCHGGGVDTGENSLEAGIRECKEELGITLNKSDMEFVLSYKSFNLTFIDVYLAKADINLENLVLQEKEVCDAKWLTLDEFDNMIKNNEVAPNVIFYYDFFKKLIKKES